MTMLEYVARHIAFSRGAFGPGERNEGITDHIQKELKEIEREDTPLGKMQEWTDCAILSLDGMWRCAEAAFPGLSNEALAAIVCSELALKQEKNINRKWPDWRTAEPGKAIEHDRSYD